MGVDCNAKDLEKIWALYNHYPVISTIKNDIIFGRFNNFQYISLGELLSSALLSYGKEDRKNYVIKELGNIFHNESKNLIIGNIDILFDPKYLIDVLGYFVQLGRSRKLIVLWSGEYHSKSLIYSKPEYRDYNKYLIKDYNVICLK